MYIIKKQLEVHSERFEKNCEIACSIKIQITQKQDVVY